MKVDVMSSHEVGSVVCGPSRDAAEGVEDAGGENSSSAPAGRADAPCLEESPWLRSRSPESGGRSAMAEQMAKPSLPGRKSTRKAFNTDDRDRTKCSLRERPQGRDEERASVTVKENDRENERPGLKKTEREESVKERPWDRERRSRTQSLVCCYTDHCQTGTAEGGLQTVLPSSSHSPNQGYSMTRSTSPDTWPPQSAVSSACPALHRPPIRTKSSPPLLPPRQSPRTAGAVDLRRHTHPASREMDPFWEEVRTGAAIRRVAKRYQNKARRLPRPISEVGEEEEEERGEEEEEEEEEEEDGEEGGARGGGGGGGVMEVTGPTLMLAVPPTSERRMSKREKNRMKSLRRRQRRRERWRQNQQQENRQSSTGNPSSSSSEDEEEDVSAGDREGYICAVCLDIYFSPYMCHPCSHVFCEPCLRTLARNSPANTPCPLCRTTITHVFFQKELNQTAKTFFPKEYLSRKQNFQKASCAKWPLPSCRKLFRIFGGLQRQSSSMARRQFPHGAGYRLDALDFEDESRGWRLDMDMVIIYIYSVNWVIGFFILCLLCYFFFPSF